MVGCSLCGLALMPCLPHFRKAHFELPRYEQVLRDVGPLLLSISALRSPRTCCDREETKQAYEGLTDVWGVLQQGSVR